MKSYSNELKVGFFVFVCLVGLFYMSYATGKLNIRKSGYNIYVLFNDVAGMQMKAPVMLNGLEVGKVNDIQNVYDGDRTQIKLKIWLDSSAKIRENPVVSIKTLGLMGEKYVEIASSRGADFIKPGTVLNGKPYMDLDSLMEEAQGMAKDLTAEVNKLVVVLNGTIADNKDSIGNIIKNLESTSKNFEDFSADIKQHPWKLLFKGKERPAR